MGLKNDHVLIFLATSVAFSHSWSFRSTVRRKDCLKEERQGFRLQVYHTYDMGVGGRNEQGNQKCKDNRRLYTL